MHLAIGYIAAFCNPYTCLFCVPCMQGAVIICAVKFTIHTFLLQQIKMPMFCMPLHIQTKLFSLFGDCLDERDFYLHKTTRLSCSSRDINRAVCIHVINGFVVLLSLNRVLFVSGFLFA